ncbi:MAG: hypothetical protein US52_C0005G0002 [candidate division WS6 bacterium GW2011_GWA2_37_6]|uniref:Toxin-antitoxin system, toxin component, RelE family n=1 Tax=candidate division WS6 bacterium GW2011_GWA2_37_6 TaxID=1619087 RepID=A0A0G0H238_9BACT|nr:MAG: hypothetical protein US52_C0005G0002 [candidate division WS6 bacterium GW2011_GWA2_37_6]
MRRRIIEFDFRAKREFNKLDLEVRHKLNKIIGTYARGENLTRDKFKELVSLGLFEFRVKHDNKIYRALAGKVGSTYIIVLVFNKKSQKIPIRYLRTAMKRLNQYYD